MRPPLQISLLIILCGFLYLPSLTAPFAYDDYPHFVENPRILSPEKLSDVFQNGYQETRPVFNASLALQAKLFGTHLFAAHLGNLLIYIFSGILLFYFLHTCFQMPLLALSAAAIFLCHPIAVESVVYFNSRSGLLALFFSLCAFLSFQSKKPSLFFFGILFLLLAIGSKEDAFAAVPLSFLFYWQRRSKNKPKWKSWQFVCVAGTSFALPFLYWFFQSPHQGTAGSSIQPWYEYLWHQGFHIPYHLSLFLRPWPLTLNHDLPQWCLSIPVVFLGWIFLLMMGLWILKKKFSIGKLGLVWALIALIPTHSIVPLLDLQASRIFYPMLPGLALAFSFGIYSLEKLSKRKIAWFIMAITVFLFSWRTYEQIHLWKDPIALWQANVQAAPSRWRAWLNLGVEFAEKKRWEEASKALSQAHKLSPNRVEVLYNMAAIAALRNDGKQDTEEAKKKLKKVLQFNPNHTRAKKLCRHLLPTQMACTEKK